MFFNSFELICRGIEKGAKTLFNVDIEGGYDELQRNPEFQLDLLMVASEIDISQYLDPKTSLFLLLLKEYYSRYSINKIKNKLNEVKLDEN